MPNDYGGAVTVHTPGEGRVTAANILRYIAGHPTKSPGGTRGSKAPLPSQQHVPLVNSQQKSDRLKDVLDTVSAGLATAASLELQVAVVFVSVAVSCSVGFTQSPQQCPVRC
ncbi:hypothetical protein [Mycobacterium leprae]|uniref:hypothetical protein n=1 Tax=Mycobacterium leprae TaxID=1769 RepID=UPI001955138C|nr:hypothetical protein [Mycobacterium leprae]